MMFSSESRIWVFAPLLLFLFLYGCDKELDALQIAPDFTFRSLDGDSVSLKEYTGKIV